MRNTVELLNIAFEESLHSLDTIYVGKEKNELKSLFHFAYWMANTKSKNDIQESILNMAYINNEQQKNDIIYLISKAIELDIK